MARALTVSVTTVRTHVQSVLAKLGVNSRLQAVALTVRTGLLDQRVSTATWLRGPPGVSPTRSLVRVPKVVSWLLGVLSTNCSPTSPVTAMPHARMATRRRTWLPTATPTCHLTWWPRRW